MSDDRLKKLIGTEPMKARLLTGPELTVRAALADALGDPEQEAEVLAAFRAQVLDQSDHSAYRELADAVTDSIIGDPNDWDGDTSELELLVRYLKSARDLARHEAAKELRKAATEGYPEDVETWVLRDAARDLDPYQRGAAGAWIRKSDGTVVSWPIVRD